MPWALLTNWRVVALVAAIVVLGATHAGAYRSGYGAGEAEVRAAWDAERIVQLSAAAKATAEREAAERAAAQRQRVIVDAYSAEIEARRADAARTRGELDRLRRALDAERARRDLLAAPTGAGSASPGADPGAGELLGACAGELARMGDEARTLAAVARGLQDYARLAVATCGADR